MSKSAKSEDRKKAAEQGQLGLRLPGLVRAALYATVIGAGLACVDEVLEAERVALCGARYVHAVDRKALRAGHAGSSLVLGGRRVAVQRPRHAVLKVASSACQAGASGARAIRWMSAPWSRCCWAYRRAATRVRWTAAGGSHARGVSQRAGSERLVYGTARKLAELMSRPARAPRGRAAARRGALWRARRAGGGGGRLARGQARAGTARGRNRERRGGARPAGRSGRARA